MLQIFTIHFYFPDFLLSLLPCRKLLLAVVLLAGLAAPQAAAQFTHLTVEQGLTQSSITCVLQDKRGFIWLGSADGLTRYDGYQFRLFKHNPANANSPVHDAISALWQDRTGKIWVGTAGGLDLFDPITETFTHFRHQPNVPTSLSDDKITCIREDREGNVWVGTRYGGLNQVIGNRTDGSKLSVSFRRHTRFAKQPGTQNPVWVSSIEQDKAGTLWIGTVGEGLFTFSPATGQAVSQRCNAPGYTGDSDINIYSLCTDATGKLWVGTDKIGFYHIAVNTRQWTRFVAPNEQLTDDAVQIVEDTPGKLWIGTWQGGLYYLDTQANQWTHYRAKEAKGSISSNKINTVYRDRTGTIWVGTWGGGINVHHPAKPSFAHFFSESKQPDAKSFVCDVYEDGAGQLWVGVVGSGLVRFDRRTETYATYRHDPHNPNSLVDEYMTTIAGDRSGRIWVGTHKGLDILDPATGRFTHLRHDPQNPNTISSNSVISVRESPDGRFWLGNSAHGLDLYDPATGAFTHYRHDPRNPGGLSSDRINYLYFDKRGLLWIATHGGLDRLDPATGAFTHYRHDPRNPGSLSHNGVTTVTEDADGNIWVGTFEQGLNKLDPKRGTFTHYREADGLPNNTIFAIIEDAHRRIWVSTNKGVSQFNPHTGKFRNFDVRDGLQANEFYLNAACTNRKGEIFMGGINGFNVFHPDKIAENTAIPPVVLTDFKIMNRSVPVGEANRAGEDEVMLPKTISECKEISIPYSSNVLSFEFAVLNYLSPEKNQYKFKLEGFEKDWVSSGNRRFTSYTNIDPGTYTFRVRGANNDGVWNDVGASLRIIITPPWWKTWWAISLYVLITAALLYLVFRYFLYQERLKNALELERLESEKLHEIDNLKTRFFANISHEFRTPLTLILGPVEARLTALPDDHPDLRDFKLMHRSARRLLTLINQLLDLSKLEAGSLKLEPKEGNLLGFFKALVYSFSSLADSRHVGLQFVADRDTIPALFDRDKVEKVVTNLLSNALKFTPEGGSVSVAVSVLSTGSTAVTRTGLGTAPQQNFVVLTITDTGIGIPADRIDKIFDRFYQVDGSNTREHSGTGIGLALTQELVHLMGGTIHVQSEQGKGTQFTVRLPLQEAHVFDEALLTADDVAPELGLLPVLRRTSEGPAPAPSEADLTAPLLMIVEDNEEVRHYIHDVFAGEYRIVEAKNGEEGMGKAQELVPDVVITDLMMPKVDGLEFCRQLKTDERTSHIPVILLTARASVESRLGGLETGADDYITKPFHVHELQLKVRNLIASRQQLRERFTREVKLQPKDIAITSADEKFLMVAIATVEKHMDDSDFSVENLECEMAMSKMQLYRKLKALTGQSPSEFIRTIRLKRAAALLSAKSGTITEIAYQVGFNNLSYFAKCFKELYGVTPSEYTDHSTAAVK